MPKLGTDKRRQTVRKCLIECLVNAIRNSNEEEWLGASRRRCFDALPIWIGRALAPICMQPVPLVAPFQLSA